MALRLSDIIAQSTDLACLERHLGHANKLNSKTKKGAAGAALRASMVELSGVRADTVVEIEAHLHPGDDSEPMSVDDLLDFFDDPAERELIMGLGLLGQIMRTKKLKGPLASELSEWQEQLRIRIAQLGAKNAYAMADRELPLTPNETGARQDLLGMADQASEGSYECLPAGMTETILASGKPALVASFFRLVASAERYSEQDSVDQIHVELGSETIGAMVRILIVHPCRIRDLADSLWALGYLGDYPEHTNALVAKITEKLGSNHFGSTMDVSLAFWAMGRNINAGAPQDAHRVQAVSLYQAAHRMEGIRQNLDLAQTIWGLGMCNVAPKAACCMGRRLLSVGGARTQDLIMAAHGLIRYSTPEHDQLAVDLAGKITETDDSACATVHAGMIRQYVNGRTRTRN